MANVTITQKKSIVDQLDEVRRRIERRAYELFRHRDGGFGDPVADWLTAEQEIVSKPLVELREKDGTFTVLVALPGVEAKDVSVDISAQEVVIEAETTHTHCEKEGKVHQCEFTAQQFFRSVHLPKAVDPTKTKAEYRNGLLTLTVQTISEAQAKRANVKVA